MIARTLVPTDARPLSVTSTEPGRRHSTELDARTMVPGDMPIGPLDTRSTIPAYMPLDVLPARVLIARDMPMGALDVASNLSKYVPLDVIATPTAVPKDAKPPEIVEHPKMRAWEMPEVLDPDVMTTGEVNLLAQPPAAMRDEKRWVLRGASALMHALAFLIIVMLMQWFPGREPTQAEIDQAAQQLGYLYLPPDLKNAPRVQAPPQPQSNKLKIDPKFLRKIAPPIPQSSAPQLPTIAREQPRDIPQTPNSSAAQQVQPPEQPRTEAPRPAPSIQPIQPGTTTPNGLVLPKYSASGSVQQGVQDLSRDSGAAPAIGFSGRLRGYGGGGGAGGGGGDFAGGMQLLTPTEGVDFNNYLARVLASVQRNWYAIIPESARMGEKGRVVLRFRIMRDGTVLNPEPILEGPSGKEPLDRAAMASIRASSPFEPLPGAFSGPYIELRFIFLYNIPLSQAQ
jgi:TonB family protein